MMRTRALSEPKSRARAIVCVTIARQARLCAKQNFFAKFGVREGVDGLESIKKERISDK